MSGTTGKVSIEHLPLLCLKLRDLNADWEQFGLILHITFDTLQQIKSNPERLSARNKMTSVLNEWRKGEGVKTLSVIYDAVKKIKNFALAERIQQLHDLDSTVDTDQDDYIDNMLTTLGGVIPQYNEFGLHIGLHHNVLQEIDGDRLTAEECIRHVIVTWIRENGDKATIYEIIDACRTIGNFALAEELENDSEIKKTFGIDRDETDEQLFVEECKKGVIKIRPLKCILSGLPRVGKTSFLSRLQGKELLEYSPSTGIEPPVSISILEPTTFSTAIVNKLGKWIHTNDVLEEGYLLLQHVKQTISSSKVATPLDSIDPSYIDKPPEEYSFMKSSEGHETPTTDYVPTREFVSKASEKSILQIVENLKESTTVYFMDTGGQPEFHELLPPILHGPALHLIFFNASLDLNERVKVKYCYKEEERESFDYTTNVSSIEILHQLLSTLYSLHLQEKSRQSKSALLGSHIDLLGDNDLQRHIMINKISNLLKQHMKVTEYYENAFLTFPCAAVTPSLVESDNDNIFLPIDNKTASGEELERIQEFLETEFKKFDPVPLPVTWAAFHLILRYKYEKLGVCTIDECTDLAEDCGIERVNVVSVLRRLHNDVGTILYYEKVNSLKDLVICDPNVLLHGISHLVAVSFAGSGANHDIAQKIRKTGKIPPHVLDKAKPLNPNCPLKVHHLIDLLAHYNLIKVIEPDYFMPCLLWPDETLTSSISANAVSKLPHPPLLIMFEGGFIPVGIFSVLVIKLSSEWKFHSNTLYRNHVDFNARSHIVKLRSCFKYLDIRITAYENASSYFYQTRRFINECLTDVLQAHQHTARTKVLEGLYCSGIFSGLPHVGKTSCPSLHEWKYHDGFLSCYPDDKCQEYTNPIPLSKLSPDHISWFEPNERSNGKSQSKEEPDDKSRSPSESNIGKTERREENTAQQRDISVQQSTSYTGGNEEPDSSGIRNYRNLLKKSPETKDVFHLTKCVSTSWNDLGRALDVSFNVRQGLEKSILDNNWKLETVLQEWNGNQTSDVTWETILKVLVECGQRNIARDVQKYLEEPEVYNKYIKKEDFIPFTPFTP